eukprot:3227768-Pyramimonas_sp.AAC.1
MSSARYPLWTPCRPPVDPTWTAGRWVATRVQSAMSSARYPQPFSLHSFCTSGCSIMRDRKS